MRALTFLIVLVLAGSPAVSAACAFECVSPEAAQASSGCDSHEAQGQARVRVVALDGCDETDDPWPFVSTSLRIAQAPALAEDAFADHWWTPRTPSTGAAPLRHASPVLALSTVLRI